MPCMWGVAISAWPELDTITGSNTTNAGRALCRHAASASAMSTLGTMPIFTASGITSSITACTCWRTSSASTGTVRCTPSVFCTVSAVTAAWA